MIQKIKITNFRNIKELETEVSSKGIIVEGPNGVGKTNFLNALIWLFTNNLITDGEDILKIEDSIIPIESGRGVNPEVLVVIDEVEFSKKYVTTFKKGSDDITGHENHYFINGARTTEKEFITKLYNLVDYAPIFNISKVKTLIIKTSY